MLFRSSAFRISQSSIWYLAAKWDVNSHIESIYGQSWYDISYHFDWTQGHDWRPYLAIRIPLTSAYNVALVIDFRGGGSTLIRFPKPGKVMFTCGHLLRCGPWKVLSVRIWDRSLMLRLKVAVQPAHCIKLNWLIENYRTVEYKLVI